MNLYCVHALWSISQTKGSKEDGPKLAAGHQQAARGYGLWPDSTCQWNSLQRLFKEGTGSHLFHLYVLYENNDGGMGFGFVSRQCNMLAAQINRLRMQLTADKSSPRRRKSTGDIFLLKN